MAGKGWLGLQVIGARSPDTSDGVKCCWEKEVKGRQVGDKKPGSSPGPVALLCDHE